MEGNVGNIFETRFPRTVGSNSYTYNVPPSGVKNTSIPVDKKDKSHYVNHALRNSSIVAGVGVLLFAPIAILGAKGKLPKPITKYLNKKSADIARKLAELRAKPQMTQAEMVYMNSLQKTSKTVDSVKGLIFNTGPLKDVLFEKFLRKIGLGKVCNAITGFFEKTAVKMTNIAYKKSGTAFAVMKDSFAQANRTMQSSPAKKVEINGVTRTVAEWGAVAEEKLKNLDTAYDAFREPARKKRYKWLAKNLDGLGSEVFEQTYGNLKTFLTSPKKWTSFITEDLAAPTKIRFARTISSKKQVITNTRHDAVKELSSIVSSIENSMDMTNKESVDIVKRLNKAVKAYKISESKNAKAEILSEIENIIKDTSAIFDSKQANYTLPTERKIRKSLGSIRHIIESGKKGEVEELLEIYAHILPKQEFEVLQKAAQKTRTALSDAVYTESDKFVDKMRDLKSGSALSDVGTGLLFPLGSTALGMSMADTKEKKRSVALKLGVPLLTGLMASTWGTIAMYAAGPSLILGAAVSTITNRICSAIDKNLKAKDAQKAQTTASLPNQ